MWYDTTVPIIRGLIGDIDSPQVYSDSRLINISIYSAHLLLGEVSFDNTYTIDVPNSSISPDPTLYPEDTNFTNLLSLRCALLIANSEFKTAAKQSFIVKDGPSTIDTGVRYKALQEFAKIAKEAYDKAKLDYIAGNSVGGAAVCTPFYFRGQPPNMLVGTMNNPNYNIYNY